MFFEGWVHLGFGLAQVAMSSSNIKPRVPRVLPVFNAGRAVMRAFIILQPFW